jgi:xylulokinase
VIDPDTAVLGIDLGTSGVRIAILDLAGNLRHSEGMPYPGAFEDPAAWVDGCRQLIASIPSDLRQRLRALAVDGTSGTLLACGEDGRPLGPALPYHLSCPEQLERLKALISDSNPAGSASGSLARALRLLDTHPRDQLLLRHQADWITGWFLQSWRYGEEGNNLRLGWNLETGRWPDTFARQLWCQALPEIRPSGALLGSIAPPIADQLGCPPNLQVIAGTTDSNAAVLTANPSAGDGITVLGSTIVLKRFVKTPLAGAGVTNHRVGGRWLCGGASNSGGVVLQQQFPGIDLEELSRQIDPEQNSGLDLRPLPARGERFPIDDPTLEPILRPRPVSDALYLHGLLEGMARIEAQGWRRLTELGAQPPKQVITVGGGARNPQWRRLRERILGLAVRSCHAPPAAGTARLALEGLQQAADLHG